MGHAFSQLPHQQVGWGQARSWEWTQLGQLTPTDKTDTAHHIMSCSATKTELKFATAAIAQGLAGHQLAGDEQLVFFTSHVFLGFVWGF